MGIVTDPIADFATRIRNAIQARKKELVSPSSKEREQIANVMADCGLIEGYEIIDSSPQKNIKVKLRYFYGNPAIQNIRRISKPGLRVYSGYKNLPEVLNGLGVGIISTPKGIMSYKIAKKKFLGGERLIEVY